jgi:hypothetical protein
MRATDAGSWATLPDGRRLWRLRVRSPGAVFLSFRFSELALPEGAELDFVSVDGAFICSGQLPTTPPPASISSSSTGPTSKAATTWAFSPAGSAPTATPSAGTST